MSTNGSKVSSYVEEKYRWINLSIYLLAALVNSVPAQAFSSINSLVEREFHYTPFIVTLNTLAFPILHPIVAVPANYILDYFGMRIGCVIGGIFLIAGVWMRILIQQGFPVYTILGSVLAAIGGIFIMNCPSKLAVAWFRQQRIPTIISISVLANLISLTAGASIPGLILYSDSTQDEIRNFFFLQAIVITIPIVLLIIFLREKPEHPPSSASQKQGLPQKDNYCVVLKKIFTNKQYLKIMLAMTFSFGNFGTVMATLDQCLSALDYNEPGQTTSVIILSCVFTGIFSTFFFSYALQKTLAYRKLIMISLIGSLVNFIGLDILLYLQVDNFIVLALSACSVGFFCTPQTALLLAYGSQALFPIGEASSGGYQFAVSQTFSFIFTTIIVNLIDKTNKTKIYIFFALELLFLFAGFILIFYTKQDLRRAKYLKFHQNEPLLPSQTH